MQIYTSLGRWQQSCVSLRERGIFCFYNCYVFSNARGRNSFCRRRFRIRSKMGGTCEGKTSKWLWERQTANRKNARKSFYDYFFGNNIFRFSAMRQWTTATADVLVCGDERYRADDRIDGWPGFLHSFFHPLYILFLSFILVWRRKRTKKIKERSDLSEWVGATRGRRDIEKEWKEKAYLHWLPTVY